MSDQSQQVSETEPGDRPAAPARRYGRRALMLGAAATGAGAAASVVGGGLAQAAPDGGSAVQLGKSNKTSATTVINSSHGTGLEGRTAKSGNAGLTGFDDTTSSTAHGMGVYGRSGYGPGVLGISDHRSGVVGNTVTTGQSGVAGLDFCTEKGAHGVYGQSNHGDGVFGISFGGNGVAGQSKTPGMSALKGVDVAPHGGNALFAQSHKGTAIWATSGSGTALKVDGKAHFSHSGLAHVPSGSKTVTVKVAGMTSSNIVLATIQQPQGSVSIAAAQAGTGQFTITLTGKATSSLPVGWFVLS